MAALSGWRIACDQRCADQRCPLVLHLFKGELKEDESYRTKAATWLTSHALLTAYRDKLEAALARLQRWMGTPLSLRALGVCITISMVYSVVFFVGSWAADGPGTVGRVVLLPELVWWQQAAWGSLALLWLFSVLLLAGFIRRIDSALEAALRRRLQTRFGERAELVAKRWYRIAGATAAASILLAAAVYAGFSGAVALASAVAGALAGALAVAVAVALAVAIALAVALALALALALAIAIAVALAIAVAGALAKALAVAGALIAIFFTGLILGIGGGPATDRVGDISFLLFFVALPIANALLDWPSWWVSRTLGQHLLTIVPGNDASRPDSGQIRSPATVGAAVLAHVVIDLVAAVLCLWGLAVLLPFLIELFNFWSEAHGNPKPLALRPFPSEAVHHPWPNGLWVLAMLLSTLVPTLLHAMALVASPVMIWLGSSDRRREIAAGLTGDNPTAAAIRGAAWQITWTWLIGLAVPLLMLAGLIWLIGAIWRPVGDLLLGAALDGMGWALSLALALGWPPA